jgi:hypothetical protein
MIRGQHPILPEPWISSTQEPWSKDATTPMCLSVKRRTALPFPAKGLTLFITMMRNMKHIFQDEVEIINDY